MVHREKYLVVNSLWSHLDCVQLHGQQRRIREIVSQIVSKATDQSKQSARRWRNDHHFQIQSKSCCFSIANQRNDFALLTPQERCGSLYTAKMERILQDTQLSRDLIKTFPTAHSLSVMVFTPSSWPFPEIARPPLSAEVRSNASFLFPDSLSCFQLRALSDTFTNFYLTHHQGRRLR